MGEQKIQQKWVKKSNGTKKSGRVGGKQINNR